MTKKLGTIACAAALWLAPQLVAAADASACYNITDADARSYCIARVRHEPAQCYNVKRADLRSQCLAEVHR